MSNKNRRAFYVDVWRDYAGDAKWSVSLADVDDEEITCLYGDNNRETAWEYALEVAKEKGIEARLLRAETQQVVRSWDPESDLITEYDE